MHTVWHHMRSLLVVYWLVNVFHINLTQTHLRKKKIFTPKIKAIETILLCCISSASLEMGNNVKTLMAYPTTFLIHNTISNGPVFLKITVSSSTPIFYFFIHARAIHSRFSSPQNYFSWCHIIMTWQTWQVSRWSVAYDSPTNTDTYPPVFVRQFFCPDKIDLTKTITVLQTGKKHQDILTVCPKLSSSPKLFISLQLC